MSELHFQQLLTGRGDIKLFFSKIAKMTLHPKKIYRFLKISFERFFHCVHISSKLFPELSLRLSDIETSFL